MIDRIGIVTEIDNTGGSRIVHRLKVDITKEGVVLQQELVVQHILTVRNTKGLAGALINILQDTFVVVVHHINKRRTEHRMVAQQQLVDSFQTAILICHIVLDTENAGHTTPTVTTVHRNSHLVMAQESIVLGIADQRKNGTVLLALTDIEDGCAQAFEVVAFEELLEINRVITLLHRTFLREEKVVAGSRKILPDT